MATLHLRPADPSWHAAFDRLMRDPYLSKKYNRERRVADHLHYLQRYAPEVLGQPITRTKIIDVGCGAGETLEWARTFGWETLGIEASGGEGGMGSGYWELSRLMHKRQGLHVLYCGWQGYIKHHSHAAALFNFRGSWAQSYAEFLGGEPHHVHHNCRQQWWKWGGELREAWALAFEFMRKNLIPGGHIVIAANDTGGSSCRARYNKDMQDLAKGAGFKLVREENKGLLLKWRKPL